MKNLSGLFEYETSGRECVITEYIGTDISECIIPDEIEGCIVTSIARYAFSGHTELSRVTFPRYLKNIGAHAFYNCRNLKHIALYDLINDMGDGAFKNCAKTDRIEITQSGGSMKCLKALMEEMNQEMCVMIHYGSATAALVFPYYMHEYEENTPGRIINQITIGSGVHYRETIGGADVDYVRYDSIFDVEKNIDVNESAWKVAYLRLRFPYALDAKDAQKYRDYLIQRKYYIASQMVKEEIYEELEIFLDMIIESKNEIEAIIEDARQSGRIKAVGCLLEYERKRWQIKKKSYDFE